MAPAFWQGKTVLLTGHTGFKGAWLSLWLRQLGAKVVGYALQPPTEPNLFGLAKLDASITSVHGDVRNLTHLQDVLNEHRPTVLFHLAAQPLVRLSYASPLETYDTNVMGTACVLEAVRRVGGVRAAVIVTSDKCYQPVARRRGYREDDPLGGPDPYSSSKSCTELVTAAYRRSFFSDTQGAPAVATARSGNAIGGGDWADDRLLPDCVRAFSAGRTVDIRNADAVRPWQHVLDPLAGYLRLAETLWQKGHAFAEAWNFAPSLRDAWPVRRVVERVIRLWGGGTWRSGGDGLHEAHVLRLDAAKARKRLAWRPRLRLDGALQWTVSWYKAVAEGADAAELCLRQIDQYTRRAGSPPEGPDE